MEVNKKIVKKKGKLIIEVSKKEPADKKPTGTRIIQDKDSITLQKL